MARKVRLTKPTVKPQTSPISLGAADPRFRRTWIILGLFSVWLAMMGFFLFKNAAGQRLWYVPVEVLALYGAALGISCWRRSDRRAHLANSHPSPAPPPETAESRPFSEPRGAESIEERLTRLSGMRDKGLITQAEYETRRREIIGEV